MVESAMCVSATVAQFNAVLVAFLKTPDERPWVGVPMPPPAPWPPLACRVWEGRMCGAPGNLPVLWAAAAWLIGRFPQ